MNEQTIIAKIHEALVEQGRPQEEIDEIHKAYEFAKKHFPNANIHQYPDALFTWYKYINDDFSKYIKILLGGK